MIEGVGNESKWDALFPSLEMEISHCYGDTVKPNVHVCRYVVHVEMKFYLFLKIQLYYHSRFNAFIRLFHYTAN